MKRRTTTAGITRAERSAQARRRRARAHLERVRSRAEPRPLPVRRLALVIGGVSALAGLVAGLLGFGQQPLARVLVHGAQRVQDAEIAAAAGLAPGTPAAELDTEALVRRLGEHAWIERARVLALPGGTLLVGVVEREPAAVLVAEERWAVDASGVPFAPAPPDGLADLPRLEAARTPVAGEADPDLARAVALVRELPERGLPAPESVRIAAPDDPEGLSLVLPGVPARVVLGREDLPARLADLARLLEAGLPELSRATRIDLRFEDQAVLEGEPSPDGAARAAATRGHVRPSNSRRAG